MSLQVTWCCKCFITLHTAMPSLLYVLPYVSLDFLPVKMMYHKFDNEMLSPLYGLPCVSSSLSYHTVQRFSHTLDTGMPFLLYALFFKILAVQTISHTLDTEMPSALYVLPCVSSRYFPAQMIYHIHDTCMCYHVSLDFLPL